MVNVDNNYPATQAFWKKTKQFLLFRAENISTSRDLDKVDDHYEPKALGFFLDEHILGNPINWPYSTLFVGFGSYFRAKLNIKNL